jgi:hypothetical protein
MLESKRKRNKKKKMSPLQIKRGPAFNELELAQRQLTQEKLIVPMVILMTIISIIIRATLIGGLV